MQIVLQSRDPEFAVGWVLGDADPNEIGRIERSAFRPEDDSLVLWL